MIRKPSRHSSVVDVVGAPHVEMERSSGILKIFALPHKFGSSTVLWLPVTSVKMCEILMGKDSPFVFLCKARFQGLHRWADSYDWLILRAASQTSFLWVVFRCIVTYMVSEQGFRDVRER